MKGLPISGNSHIGSLMSTYVDVVANLFGLSLRVLQLVVTVLAVLALGCGGYYKVSFLQISHKLTLAVYSVSTMKNLEKPSGHPY